MYVHIFCAVEGDTREISGTIQKLYRPENKIGRKLPATLPTERRRSCSLRGGAYSSRGTVSRVPREKSFSRSPIHPSAHVPGPLLAFLSSSVSHISFCLQQGFPVIRASERSESPPTAPKLWLLSRLCLVPWILICSLVSVAETRTRPCMCGSLFIKIILCGSPPLLVCLKPIEKNMT